MLYIGSGGTNQDACQIDPALPIIFAEGLGFDVRQIYSTYGYRDIKPEARGAYLTWLAEGKCAKNANIGNVLLYFYGLERRVLLEPVTAELLGETPLIASEIRRLVEVYGENATFREYAISLLEFLEVRNLVEVSPPISPPMYEMSRQIPFKLRVGLAKYVKERLPIPGPWAFAWWLAHPETRLRTPAKRCPDEFRCMFIDRYHKAHGAGLLIKANKTRLTVEHQPASPFLKGRVFDLELCLPDVTATTGPVKIFSMIAEECYQSLNRYSRYLGRNPDKEGTFDAILELPISLWPDHMKQSLKKIYELVSGMEFGSGDLVSVRFGNIRSHLPAWKNVTRNSFDAFARSLSEIGINIFTWDGSCPSDGYEIGVIVDRSLTRFEFDSKLLSSSVNQAITEPVTVRPPTASSQGFTIPGCPPKKPSRSLELDFEKVSTLEADSRRVSDMLHSIFQDTSQEVPPIPGIETNIAHASDNDLWGLNSEFSKFLQLLSTRPAWSRAELEELAADRSLMLDGVLEHINEAALDRFDQPFTEGDDPLEINQELIKEISS